MSSSYEEVLKQVEQRKQALKAQLANLLADTSEFTLEIGCGHGHYLSAYAQEHSEQLCVGIDLMHNRIERGNVKKDRAELPNLHFIKAEANEFLECLPVHARPNRVFILFLDPWPKKRHFKNRLIQNTFLSELAKKTAPDTQAFFRTDHKGYFQWAREHFESHADWLIDCSSSWPFEASSIFQERMGDYQSLIAKKK